MLFWKENTLRPPARLALPISHAQTYPVTKVYVLIVLRQRQRSRYIKSLDWPEILSLLVGESLY